MQLSSEDALQAASDPKAAEAFIEQSRQFILRCASKFTHKYVTVSDDEWSVAMIAFSEAITSYDAEKGSFPLFAELVIRRRLLDFQRSEFRHSGELYVDPSVFEGHIDAEAADAALQESVVQRTIQLEDSSISDEINAVSSVLSEYGFSFADLTACSPKAAKTRSSCAQAIRFLLNTPPLISDMRQSSTLPIRLICKNTTVPRKILDRHRKYIIAAAEILHGDYPCLAEYLNFVRKDVEK